MTRGTVEVSYQPRGFVAEAVENNGGSGKMGKKWSLTVLRTYA